MKKIIFITGTDTGVGKTVLTALLLTHLRNRGCEALAMKPFCSGSRGDARLFYKLQEGCLTLDEVNPFYYDKPLAPAAAGRSVPFRDVVARIRALSKRCELLLIEGAGGLLSPLGNDYTARTLISALSCKSLIASQNRLGTINHTLLTVESLQDATEEEITVVLMGAEKPGLSASTNAKMLRQRLGSARLFSIPYLGKRSTTPQSVKNNVKFVKIVLARLI